MEIRHLGQEEDRNDGTVRTLLIPIRQEIPSAHQILQKCHGCNSQAHLQDGSCYGYAGYRSKLKLIEGSNSKKHSKDDSNKIRQTVEIHI